MIEEIVNFSAALGVSRNQHARGTCLAFASSDFNRHANNVGEPLSVEYLAHHAIKLIPDWKAGDGLRVPAVLSALKQPGQPVESSYTYDPHDHGRPLQTVPEEVGTLYSSAPTASRGAVDEIVAAIKAEKAVGLVLALSQKFMTPNMGVVEYSANYLPNALHAVVGVGIGEHMKTNETYILIRNSWGEVWGQNGHAWLPLEYLKTHLVNSFAL